LCLPQDVQAEAFDEPGVACGPGAGTPGLEPLQYGGVAPVLLHPKECESTVC
jgi:hypothetical protein